MRVITFVNFLLAGAPLFAGEVKVAWQPNTEPDLAGYVVYYGPKERPQRHRIEVGRQTQYLIQNLQPGLTYFVTVTAADREGNESLPAERIAVRLGGDQEENNGAPPQHYLLPNYPNPFPASTPLRTSATETTIPFLLNADSPVRLEIFNLLGQRVITLRDESMKAGLRTVNWNGRDEKNHPVQSGIYVYRLQTSDQVSTRKMVVF